jgi:hypothetical protein
MRSFWACLFALAAFSTANAQTPEVLVRQIDHIMLVSDEAEELFRLFSEKLSLPVAWPFQSNPSFSSGGVSFGNVNIELIRFTQRRQPGFRGVALEPNSLTEVVTGMDVRGLKHGDPAPFHGKDPSGAERLLWTNISLPTLQPAFLCKFNFFEVDDRRASLHRELRNRSGGPLGIETAMELVIGVRDMATAQRDWSILLGPVPSAQDRVWQIGSGPSIRLVTAQEDHLALLRVKVKSLERARAFLKAENLLGLDAGREISIDRSRVAGADIRLVE